MRRPTPASCLIMGVVAVLASCAGTLDVSEDSNEGPSDEDFADWGLVEGRGDGENFRIGDEIGRLCDVPAYYNGPKYDLCLGKTCRQSDPSVYGLYGYLRQCTEFAARFTCKVFLGCEKKDGPYGHAKEWFSNYSNNIYGSIPSSRRYRSGVTKELPRPGDIITFSTRSEFGHVAIVQSVDTTQSSILTIDQNIGTVALNSRPMTVSRSGVVSVRGAIGWMRPTAGPLPPCLTGGEAVSYPVALKPDGDTFKSPAQVTFTWTLAARVTTSHALKIRHLETDKVVFEQELGSSTSRTVSLTEIGHYRWTVYYRDSHCQAGECAAPAKEFIIANSVLPCPSNCSGHGTCDGGTGTCRCDPPYTGIACDQCTRSCNLRCGGAADGCGGTCSSCPTGYACSGQSCVPCGAQSQPCCNGACTGGLQCRNGTCGDCPRNCNGKCGGASDGCGGTCNDLCPTGSFCNVQTCEPCGAQGQRCCNNAFCNTGLTCNSNQRCGSCSITSSPAIGQWTPTFVVATNCTCADWDTSCHALYRARVLQINGALADIEIQKADASAFSAGRTYWVVVGEARALCTRLTWYVERTSGTIPGTPTNYTIRNVPIWPSSGAFGSDPPGTAKDIFVITDGQTTVGQKIWFQPDAIRFTKVCQ